MRLTCPNCAAQYEVDDDVIPPEGRDVQCSDCGHGWYQYPTDMTTRLTPPDTTAEPPQDAGPTGAQPEAEPDAMQPPKTQASHGSQDEGAGAPTTEPPSSATDPTPPPAPARERLDDSVLGILREEAERETRARQAERRSALETQPELGIDAAPSVARTPQNDMDEPETGDPNATHEPDAPSTADTAAPRPMRPASRRHQLPDIEEINSSLRASSERRPGEAGAEALPAQTGARRKGFRLGLALVLSLATIAIGLYALAPTATQTWPAAAPYLESYVAMVDEGRRWLGSTAQNATEALTEALAAQD